VELRTLPASARCGPPPFGRGADPHRKPIARALHDVLSVNLEHVAQRNMRPPSAPSCLDALAVQFAGNGVVAGEPGLLYLADPVNTFAARRAAEASRAAVPRAAQIISRSCSATARICTVSLLACGLYTATNSTPLSIDVAMNATLRDRRWTVSSRRGPLE
jgi:hypothetical protein